MTDKPHDRFFKSAFVERRVVLEALDKHLPAEVKAIADLEHYELVRESFIDAELAQQISDVLISVPLENDGTAYCYCLFEHQRKPRKLMSWRMQQLVHGIMDYHLRTKGADRLPLVVKVVVYNGETAWNESTDFYDLFDVPADLARKVMTAPYQLLDLCNIPDEELKDKTLLWGLTQLLLKHINDPEIIHMIGDLASRLARLDQDGSGLRYFEIAFRYLLEAGKPKGGGDLLNVVQNAVQSIQDSRFKEKAMTIAELLRQQGQAEARAEGKAEGKAEGLAEGEVKGKAEGLAEGKIKGKNEMTANVAVKMLKKGMPFSDISEITGLSRNQINRLAADLQ